ncbi:MAG TPA: DegT/DnrJ/EryC1/StrS family aminotransferase [Tepidisphaeraceae bacterium]|jgi:dTDP-4-amino-4,6-dideoxygalactose transaminase
MQAADLEKPAIAGGTPIRTTPFVPPNRYGPDELREVQSALEQGTLFYAQGKKVKQFEAEFAAQLGFSHGVATSSGTAGIHAALISAGISPGDEVIVPPITDMGSIVPILYQGAIPVFADLDLKSGTLLPESVEKNLTTKTRAIIAVQLAGNACDMDALTAIAAKKQLTLIEDCAQAHGTKYHGKAVGHFGACGCYSFNEFKHVSCGDGGIVVTNNAEFARRLRLATDKAYSREPGVSRSPEFLANNYRMTELQGAVALAQTRKINNIVARHHAWCSQLTQRLQECRGLSLPTPTPGCEHSYWFYLMRVLPELGADASEFAAALKAEGLPASAHYIAKPIYEYPLFLNHSAFAHAAHPFIERKYYTGLCPNAEEILRTCVNLQIHQAYGPEELDTFVRAITRVVNWFNQKR